MLVASRTLNFFRGVVLLLKGIDKLGVADSTYVNLHVVLLQSEMENPGF